MLAVLGLLPGSLREQMRYHQAAELDDEAAGGGVKAASSQSGQSVTEAVGRSVDREPST